MKLSKVMSNLFFLSVYISLNFITTINCFTYKIETDQLSHCIFQFIVFNHQVKKKLIKYFFSKKKKKSLGCNNET